MKNYIGIKLIKAEELSKDGKEGYKVKYSDSYESWSPKEAFESAYFNIEAENKISQADVEKFISKYEVQRFDECTCVVKATLVSGFTILEHSSCVDAKNYNHEIGINICKERIKNKVWNHLGFLLQAAKDGVNK